MQELEILLFVIAVAIFIFFSATYTSYKASGSTDTFSQYLIDLGKELGYIILIVGAIVLVMLFFSNT